MKAGEVTGLHTEKLHMKKCFKLLFLTAYVKTVWRFPTDGMNSKLGAGQVANLSGFFQSLRPLF